MSKKASFTYCPSLQLFPERKNMARSVKEVVQGTRREIHGQKIPDHWDIFAWAISRIPLENEVVGFAQGVGRDEGTSRIIWSNGSFIQVG